MEYAAERWVQRLRDGQMLRRGPVLLAAAITTAVGLALLVAEFAFPDFLRGIDNARTQASFVVWPLIVVGFGLLLAVSTMASGRADRRTLARIGAGRAPRFHLPVLTSGLRTSDDFPKPRPEIWTVDEFGLHAWAPSRDQPVFDMPWARVDRFSVATKDSRGQRVDFGIWITTVDGQDVVVEPRPTLGRGFEAGPGKLDTLVRVLRALQRELGVASAPDDHH
ncbi:hypothetical protein [Curtobacterium aurantiacum]|uniref:Uncharacterized protein n=1 Tax=Curtobacterium aurantiacum TaxID=3236919 RepID=A0ABS5VH29_9MICO|nr:hypothetical protein [Curtobacterium flaccumfaciens]MBT1546693.1 hypothetical protein [Curtobacterium flaccumfaciens pv. flaccumfaciens]MBT1588402.1 hypothetical protein [Curtobacterium flaccumfaciens pv. flaccumfaciens]